MKIDWTEWINSDSLTTSQTKKAVLVIDLPLDCWDCHLVDEWENCNAIKITSRRYGMNVKQYYKEKRPSWCPLRPLPRKIDIKAQEDIDYQRFYENPDAKRLADEIVESQGHTRIGSTRDIYHAWNACLDEITGETE